MRSATFDYWKPPRSYPRVGLADAYFRPPTSAGYAQRYWSPPRSYPHWGVAATGTTFPPYRGYAGRTALYGGLGQTVWRDPRLGQLPTSAAEVQARIQAEVGNFLAARQELDRMRARARTADQLANVEALYADQSALEAQLPATLDAARSLQQGEFNLVLGAQVVSFATRMTGHLGRVRALRASMGLGAADGAGIPWGRVVLWGGGGLVGLMVFRRMMRR